MSALSQRSVSRRSLIIAQDTPAPPVVGAALSFGLAVAFLLVHRSVLAAAGLLVLPAVGWLLTRSYGGVVFGLATVLALPYWQTLGTPQANVLRIASAAALATLLVTRRFSPRPSDYLLLAYVAIVVISWLLQFDQPHAGRIVSVELTPIAFYLGARAFPRIYVPLAMRVGLFAGTVGALTVVYEFVRGSAVFINPAKYVWNQTAQFIFRPGGLFGSPPGASTVLCVVILFGVAAAAGARGRRRVLCTVCLVICTVALLLTFTRAAIIAVAAGLLLLLWLIRSPLLRPLRVAWFVVAVIAISVLAVPALQNNSTFEKGIVRAGTLTQRESYWGFALPIATSNAHNMLFGIGSGALEAPNVAANVPVAAEVSASPQVVKNSLHSQYLTTLLEQGLLGLTVMVLFLVSVFLPCARLARKTRDPALSALAASILSMAIIMSVDTTFLHGPSFAMLMVSAGLITGALTHRADAVRSSPEETSHGNVGTAQTG